MKGTAIFLQVRLDSSRLPRKALLPLGGKAVISHAMEALSQVPVERYVLLTDEESRAGLSPLAEEAGFELFTGPKEDVLARYTMAVEHFQVVHFIRATGDNPLVSVGCAESLLQTHVRSGADYSAYTGLPLGTGVECVRSEALLDAHARATERYDREHVCPYLYRHPEKYRIFRPQADEAFQAPDLRVTLDTREDYERLQDIFRHLYRGYPIHTDELIHSVARNSSLSG